MEGVYSLIPGMKLVGRAVTLRFLPQRPDLQEEMRNRDISPEYEAMELCGPGDVLVMDALNLPYASTGGDVKFSRLKFKKAEGLVTDGAVRDLKTLRTYGIGIFARNTTPTAGPTLILPYEVNVPISCARVLVRPGDVIFGDDDGVVVIPATFVAEFLEEAREKEAIEEWIKACLAMEDVSPGKYYPITEQTKRLYYESIEKKG